MVWSSHEEHRLSLIVRPMLRLYPFFLTQYVIADIAAQPNLPTAGQAQAAAAAAALNLSDVQGDIL